MLLTLMIDLFAENFSKHNPAYFIQKLDPDLENIFLFICAVHYLKIVCIRRDTRIQSERGKIRTRKFPNTDAFHAVVLKAKIWLKL